MVDQSEVYVARYLLLKSTVMFSKSILKKQVCIFLSSQITNQIAALRNSEAKSCIQIKEPCVDLSSIALCRLNPVSVLVLTDTSCS